MRTLFRMAVTALVRGHADSPRLMLADVAACRLQRKRDRKAFQLALGFGFLVLASRLMAGVWVTLNPGIPLQTLPPARPAFEITLAPQVVFDANGASAAAFIDYYTVNSVGHTSQNYEIYTNQYYSANWSDGRGNLPQGNYTYQVTAYGIDPTPYNNGWVEGYEYEEHNNPDDPDEVTGGYWVPAQYDAGFTWGEGAIESTSVQFALQPYPPVIANGGTVACAANAAFSFTISASNNPTGYGLTGTLPPGLTFNSSNGQISGTTSQLGTYNVTIIASNGGGPGSAALAIVVTSPIAPAIGTQPSSVAAVPAPSPFSVSLATNGASSFAVKYDGTLWAWGYNGSGGALGDGTTAHRLTPVNTLGGISLVGPAGIYQGTALKFDRTVVTWGDDPSHLTPVAVDLLTDAVFPAGSNQSDFAVKSDGTVAVWGATAAVWPTLINGLNSVTAISTGSFHALFLRQGVVWARGWNSNGQLGNGTWVDSQVTPVQVSALSSVVSIAAGGSYSVAAKADGTVWAWGWNYPHTVDSSGVNRAVPVQVAGLADIAQVSAGMTHSLALKKDGTVWSWGNFLAPAQVPGLSGVASVACGWGHNLALMSDGTVKAWGYNTEGQLGNGTTTNSSTPVTVSGLSGVLLPTTFAPLSFTIGATGHPAPTYQWQSRANGQSSFANLSNSLEYSGVTSAVLTVLKPTLGMMSAEFRCVVTNIAGAVTSASATIVFPNGTWTDADGDGVADAIETLFGVQSQPNPTGASNLNLNVHRPQ